MSYAQILLELFETGAVQASRPMPLGDDDVRELEAVLIDFEGQYRHTLPDGLPEFDRVAGRWAAVNFVRACQSEVYRDIGEEQFGHLFAPALQPDSANAGNKKAEPQAHSASTHYSVDVVFRFLPGLYKFAKAQAEADPLVKQLLNWAQDWPLSSVGIELPAAAEVAAIIANPGLRQMYVDRILAAGDKSRLNEPRVRQAVKASWGLYPQLGGRIATAVSELESATTDSTTDSPTEKL